MSSIIIHVIASIIYSLKSPISIVDCIKQFYVEYQQFFSFHERSNEENLKKAGFLLRINAERYNNTM